MISNRFCGIKTCVCACDAFLLLHIADTINLQPLVTDYNTACVLISITCILMSYHYMRAVMYMCASVYC